MTAFLTGEQIAQLHQAGLDAYGGDSGAGHRGTSNAAAATVAAAVQNSYYEDISELAAAYAVYIVQGHVFLDGNKRAASAAMLTFLEGNGVSLRASADLSIQAAMIIVQRKSDPNSFKPWPAEALVEWLARTIREEWVERQGHARGRVGAPLKVAGRVRKA